MIPGTLDRRVRGCTTTGVRRSEPLRSAAGANVRTEFDRDEAPLAPVLEGDVERNPARLKSVRATRRGRAAKDRRREVSPDADAHWLAVVAENMPGTMFRRVLHPDGSLRFDYVSPQALDQFGAQRTSRTSGHAQDFVNAIHPDDRAGWWSAIRKSAVHLSHFDHEFRVADPHGVFRWMRSIARTWRREDGAIIWDGITLDVSKRKRAEADAQERAQQLDSIGAHFPGAIYRRVLHADGRNEFPYFSHGIVAINGYTPAEIAAAPDLPPSTVIAEDRPSYDAAIEASQRSGGALHWQGRIRARDGRVRWIEIVATATRGTDGSTTWDGALFDISDRKRVEAEALERARQLEAIGENFPGVVYRRVQHADGRVSYPYVSAGAHAVYGYAPADFMADPNLLPNLVLPEDRAAQQTSIRSSAHSLAQRRWEGRARRRDGTVIWVETVNTPHLLPNGDVAWDGFILDITARKLAQAALEESRALAESANRAKSQFLANMSHELRTPLNAILGFSELVQRELHGPVKPAEYRDYVNNIHTSGTHLLALVNNLLDLAKIEAGRYSVAVGTADLARIAANCLTMVAANAEARGIELRSVQPTELLGRADERAAKQVLLNLLSNAIKFSPEGGRVSLSADLSDPRWIMIRVEDEGPGIPPEMVSRIFEPFVQADVTLARQHEGTGLGLTIGKHLMELQGGALAIGPKASGGTVAIARFARASASERAGA